MVWNMGMIERAVKEATNNYGLTYTVKEEWFIKHIAGEGKPFGGRIDDYVD
jgi:hypothetical protein